MIFVWLIDRRVCTQLSMPCKCLLSFEYSNVSSLLERFTYRLMILMIFVNNIKDDAMNRIWCAIIEFDDLLASLFYNCAILTTKWAAKLGLKVKTFSRRKRYRKGFENGKHIDTQLYRRAEARKTYGMILWTNQRTNQRRNKRTNNQTNKRNNERTNK